MPKLTLENGFFLTPRIQYTKLHSVIPTVLKVQFSRTVLDNCTQCHKSYVLIPKSCSRTLLFATLIRCIHAYISPARRFVMTTFVFTVD